MDRLLLEKEKKPNINWFQEFYALKKELGLSMEHCIKLFYSLKRGKTILIQSVTDENALNMKLDKAYHFLKNFYWADTEHVSSFASIVDANHYVYYPIEELRNEFRVYISRI